MRNLLDHYGLRIRIIALISILTMILVFLIGIVVLKIAEHNIIKQKIDSGKIVIKGIQSGLDTFWHGRDSLIYDSDDVESLNRLVTKTGRNLQLLGFRLIDRNMRVIAATNSGMMGVYTEDRDIREAFFTGKTDWEFVGEHGAFGFGLYDEVIFTGPLRLGNDIVAIARFGVPLGDVSMSLSGTLNMLYLYTFLDVLLVLILGGFLMMVFIVRPINELRRFTERIIQGDLDHPILIRSHNEIGLLARDLETLRQTLEGKESTVQDQMKSLESLNKQLKRIRDQLIHTDRLAYIGRVAAGVAHEIGNPLGSIYGYLDILKTSRDDPEIFADVVDRIGGEIGRIDRIVRELLDFSRPQKEGQGPVDLSALIAECVEILRAQRVLDKVSVEIQSDQSGSTIYAEAGQIKQVFLNLMINAVDAMGGTGRIEINISHWTYDREFALMPMLGYEPELDTGETAFTDIDKRGIVFSSRIPYTEGERIVTASVRDSGPGINRKNLENIFEPFFTTKEKSKGTGLGLSICQRIVESFGGVLRVQSRRNAGTVVTCFFMPERLEEDEK